MVNQLIDMKILQVFKIPEIDSCIGSKVNDGVDIGAHLKVAIRASALGI